MHEHRCLVCGYEGDAEFYPRDYLICGCCGTEFGYDDRVLTHSDLRLRWILGGAPWFDPNEPKPPQWSPFTQLEAAGFYGEMFGAFGTADTIGGDAEIKGGHFADFSLEYAFR